MMKALDPAPSFHYQYIPDPEDQYSGYLITTITWP
jgi:hypothetical protein